MRLGIFGGSFDPVHMGHLLLAEHCREQCQLDQLWLIPASTSPHKQGEPRTAGEHRVEMLKLAVGGHEQLLVSTLEIERGGVSYTVDTLEEIKRSHPDAELFLALGADSLVDLPNWREPGRICELATLMVVARPGTSPSELATMTGSLGAAMAPRIVEITMPQIDLRSRELRRRRANGQSIRFQTPRAVEQYIASHGLYTS